MPWHWLSENIPHPTIPLPPSVSAPFPCACSCNLSQKSWQQSWFSLLPPHHPSTHSSWALSPPLQWSHSSVVTSHLCPAKSNIQFSGLTLFSLREDHWIIVSSRPIRHHSLSGFLLPRGCCPLSSWLSPLSWPQCWPRAWSLALGHPLYVHSLPTCFHPAGNFTSSCMLMMPPFHPQAWVFPWASHLNIQLPTLPASPLRCLMGISTCSELDSWLPLPNLFLAQSSPTSYWHLYPLNWSDQTLGSHP